MPKKIVDVKREHAKLTYELCGTIDEVIERLIQLKSTQKEGEVLVLEYETEYAGYGYGDSDRQQVNLYDRRLETDEEYQIRLDKEAAAKEQSIARKRAQLEALKKELGE